MNAFSTSVEDINYQQDVLVAALCPRSEDPAECEASPPDFWRAIALRLWPGYYDPEAEWMCAPPFQDPQDHILTCEECVQGLKASIDQLADPRSIDVIVERFLKSDCCFTIPDERCPQFLEAVLREGIPVLAETSNPEEYPPFCEAVLPGTCPARNMIF